MGIIELAILIIVLLIFLFCMFWPISVPLLIIYLIKRNKNKKAFKSMVISNKDFTDINQSKLDGFDITDIPKLKMYLFDIFYKFETAYNNVDYNTMYNLSTSKLYELYHTNIVLNLKFDEKKIIDQIKLNKMFITDAYSSKYKQVVTTVVDMSYINYTIKSDGKVVSGSPTKQINEKFEVIFIKYFDNKDDFRCPNCGANVKGTTCEYCNSNITNSGEFRIDSIKKIV